MPEAEPLLLTQFQYELPDERIARFPLDQRDKSKLLVYRSGTIQHQSFSDLPGLLPENSFLVFNNTKVIPARLHFTRATGAIIELFLLNPVSEADSDELPISQAMERTGSVIWHAMIGNRKRWKSGETLETTLTTPSGSILLKADWHNQEASTVRLSWQPAEWSFAQLIQLAGEIPLPPYLKRDAIDADRTTYQTVYSKEEGAVAAPTAGLHFTDAVFTELNTHGIGHDYVTLHVGAGTFQPIKTDDVREHHMHTEEVVYTAANVQNLLEHLDHIIAVGTTSMRALESLYWMGVKLLKNEPDPFRLDQHYAYRWLETERPSAKASLLAVSQYLTETKKNAVVAHTGIYITPGYKLAICRGLITNFHQPGSTLILLIATLIGDDWRTVYHEALTHDYRFLSYGDSSLLLP
jgi:S-adenosylmethionine:tRNA ribosyltransferase-isomerase